MDVLDVLGCDAQPGGRELRPETDAVPLALLQRQRKRGQDFSHPQQPFRQRFFLNCNCKDCKLRMKSKKKYKK